MIDFDVKADFDEVNRMLHDVETSLVTKAANSSLNKTIKSVQSIAVKDISKDIGLTQKDTRRYLIIKRATWRNLVASVEGSGKRIAINRLKPRQIKKGVTYRGEGGGRKLIPGAFMAPIPGSNKMGVFKRVGKKRMPINFLRSVSIPKVMTKEAVERAMKDVAAERWKKNFQHELDYRLRKYR